MNISELSSAICQRLNHINQKPPEENVIIEYGMTLFLENVSKLLLILAIGFLIGEGKESFIILFTFCMFRLQAGGMHAKNNIGCTLSMLFIWGLSLTASRYVTIGIPALVCIFIIGIAAVLLWVPQSINIGYFTSEATAVSATIKAIVSVATGIDPAVKVVVSAITVVANYIFQNSIKWTYVIEYVAFRWTEIPTAAVQQRAVERTIRTFYTDSNYATAIDSVTTTAYAKDYKD